LLLRLGRDCLPLSRSASAFDAGVGIVSAERSSLDSMLLAAFILSRAAEKQLELLRCRQCSSFCMMSDLDEVFARIVADLSGPI
jgi:hypothetical protein